MASLIRLGARGLSRQYCQHNSVSRIVVQTRSMGGGSEWDGAPPTTTLGGMFKNPV